MLDKFRREDEPNERKRLHCVDCQRVTIHNLEARCVGSWSEPEIGENGEEIYSIFRCGACDAVSYETVSWNSQEVGYDDDGEIYAPQHATQYPAPTSAHFTFNTESTPTDLDAILDEMLYALAGSKMILATIGLRLAIEFIVNNNNCAGAKLYHKIDDLHSKGFIDEDQKDLLHRIRKRGNAGAHGAVAMEVKEIVAGMSVIDGLLEKLYNGPARHERTIERAKKMIKDKHGEKS